jgi:hypothetical protein
MCPGEALQVEHDGEVLSANPKRSKALLGVVKGHVGRRRSRPLSRVRWCLRRSRVLDGLALSHCTTSAPGQT